MQTIDSQLPVLLHVDGESAFCPSTLSVLYIEVHQHGRCKTDKHGK